MNRKQFTNTYAISNNDIPAIQPLAEKLAESRGIWFITELSIRNEHDDLFPDESLLENIASSTASHRNILLIVDDECRNKSLYDNISWAWQQFNGIVLHTTQTGKPELLEKIVKQHSFSATERSLCFVPTLTMMDVRVDLPALGYMGCIQKLMLSRDERIASFFDIEIGVLEMNPAVVKYKENNNEHEG